MTLLVFLFVLSLLVLIHEFGHFIAARFFGVKVDEFGFGFPPRVVGFIREAGGKWRKVTRRLGDAYPQTVWSLNWLPLGGFVRLKGEEAGPDSQPDMFHSHPAWQRFCILMAGVAMNLLLAIVLLTVIFSVGTYTTLDQIPGGASVEDRSVRIVQVLPGSPADQAGLKVNDRVQTVGGAMPKTMEETRQLIGAYDRESVPLRVRRGEKIVDLQVTPAYLADIQKYGLGVGLADVGRVSFSPPVALWIGVRTTFGYAGNILTTFADLIGDVFRRRPVEQQLSGPVGIAVMAGEIAQQGIVPLLQFAAVLSINLAVVNALPIPALDGGRVLFLILEKVRRRKMARKVEVTIHNVAMLVLLLLIVFVTIQDLGRYGGVIMSGVKGLIGL